MASARAEQASRHRIIQAIVALYSFIFFGVIAYGYFYLFVNANVAVALVIATVAALLAWFLAKFIGSSEGGIKANRPLFALLLAISAAGVYNSAMLYWEGDRIISDTASDSQERYGAMQAAAEQTLADSGVVRRVDRILEIREALFSEIRNPLNCGQGPEAMRLIAELRTQLPGFEPLSNPGSQCSRNDEVIEDYRKKTDDLISRSPWNNAGLRAIIDQIQTARKELGRLHASASTDYNPSMLKSSLATLEGLNDRYRDIYFRLAKQSNLDKVPSSLNVSEVQNLGDATKLPILIVNRLDVGTTYVYLLLAISFDWLMVHLFSQSVRNRVHRPVSSSAISGAW